MNIKTHNAFTLIELLIALVILSVILAIAIPNYARSREESHKNTCIANLKQIDSAIDQWATERGIPVGTVPSGGDEEEIYSYLRNSRPRCPAGGVYSMHAVGDTEQITCSFADRGHEI